jgi:hypothetical protein
MRLARGLAGEADHGEGRRRGLGFPHAFDGGELHLLVLGRQVAALIAQHRHRQGRGQAERGRHRHRALGQRQVPALQHIPGRYAQHEDGGAHITGRHRVHELGLRHGVGQHGEEVGHFHAHGLRIEGRAHRVLHPAVGDQNPQRREIGADGHGPSRHQMTDFRKLVPAEEEQADEGGFHEERHQPFDGQRRAEDVAHVMAVVAPVHAELEFHHHAGGHAHGEVDAEKRAPELGHVAPDHAAGHHVDRLHDGDQHRQPERERHEQKVVQRRDGELQPRQGNDVEFHGVPLLFS